MIFLKKIAENIWIIDADSVPWFGFPYTTRMTIVRLPGDKLWVHSPGKIIDKMLAEIATLGQVCYLVSPNKIHHLFIGDWIEVFPRAISYSSPGLRAKRADISFNKELVDFPEIRVGQ